jgi:hypothetical protein
MDDHFIVLTIESTFKSIPTKESVQFRVYLLGLLQTSFLNNNNEHKLNADSDKVITIITRN